MSWYFNRDLKPQGPCTLDQMRLKIHQGEIGPQELLLNEEVGEWKPAQEWRNFEASLFPAHQQNFQAEEVAVEIAGEWVLLREVQEGPYSTSQLRGMIEARQVVGTHYVWKNGLSGWVRVQDRKEFSALISLSL